MISGSFNNERVFVNNSPSLQLDELKNEKNMGPNSNIFGSLLSNFPAIEVLENNIDNNKKVN